MNTVQPFAERVAARLAQGRMGARAAPETAHMAQFEARYRQFDELANRWVTEVIRPCLETVARFFPNAEVRPAARENRCAVWFGYCERFPHTVKLEFSVDADDRLEQAILRYELRIIPAFVKYESHDKLAQPWDQIDEKQVAAWVEDRLLGFLDTYLILDRGADDADESLATDPVCGMKVAVAATALQADYRGHAYYFCSEACRQRFSSSPERFVRFETD